MSGRFWIFGLVLVSAIIGLAVYEPKLDEDRVQGLRVVVTGCTSGIGLEIARLYARLGAKIILVARNEDKLRRTQQVCQDLGAQYVDYVQADLSSSDETVYSDIIKSSVKKLGGLDSLVLNHISTVDQYHQKGWHKVQDMSIVRRLFEVNAFSHMALVHAALDPLSASKGKIIFVSSVTGVRGLPNVAPYSSTKHAMHGFLESLRIDLAIAKLPVDITMCIIGNIDTESNRKAVEGTSLAKAQRASPQECAYAIVRGGETRARDVFFPFGVVYPFHLLSSIVPRAADSLLVYLYQNEELMQYI